MISLRIEHVDDVTVAYFTDTKILEDARIQQIGADLLEAANAATSKRMVVNFDRVSFMSSAMIGKLVSLHKHCQKAGVALKFSDVSPNLTEVFKITNLHKLFDIQKTLDKAVKSFDKKGWFG